MRIVLRVDASPVIGGGHLMRCLTLAGALAARGAEITFVCARMTEPLADRVRAAGYEMRRIALGRMERQGAWDTIPPDAAEEDEDARLTLEAMDEPADWLIVDHYRLGAQYERQVRSRAARILAIDDLANRAHDCDLLLDQTFGRQAGDYARLVPAGCSLLAGARYALIRPEFVRERPAALHRRRDGGPVRRILVSLGTTDLGGITARVVEAAASVAGEAILDVVIGPEAPSLATVAAMAARDRRIALHIDSREMAGLMRDADLAVGAAGTSSWERCCLGLPAINLILAQNQVYVARMLDEAGAAISVDDVAQLPAALGRLLADEPLRLALVAASAAVTGGGGAALVAQAMLPNDRERQASADPVRLRAATAADAEPLWLWRNDYGTRTASPKADAVTWPTHVAWLEPVLRSPERHLLIVERGGEAIGMVRFDALPDAGLAFEVSINVHPEARGSGTGRAVLEAACKHFLAQTGPVALHASISKRNPASRRIFESLGFGYAAPLGEGGFDRYVRPADPADPFLAVER